MKKTPGTFAFGSDKWPGLAKLNEECGEVNQVIGKLMQTDGDPSHWSGNLRNKLIDELADVAAAISFVVENNFTETEMRKIFARTSRKMAKFKSWHEENKS